MLKKYYKNFNIIWAGVLIYRGLSFGIYDSLKPLKDSIYQDNFTASLSLGFISNTVAILMSYPFENIRRMLILSNKYESATDCIAQVFKNEGIKPFFSRANVSLLNFVSGGCVLALYDRFQSSRRLQSRKDEG